VNHHIAEQTTGYANILNRRSARVAAEDGHHFDIPDCSGLNLTFHRQKVRIEAPVKRQHEGNWVDFEVSDHPFDSLQRQIDRFLAEYRLARTGGTLNLISMHICRRGYNNRIDLGVAKRIGLFHEFCIILFCKRFSGFLNGINNAI